MRCQRVLKKTVSVTQQACWHVTRDSRNSARWQTWPQSCIITLSHHHIITSSHYHIITSSHYHIITLSHHHRACSLRAFSSHHLFYNNHFVLHLFIQIKSNFIYIAHFIPGGNTMRFTERKKGLGDKYTYVWCSFSRGKQNTRSPTKPAMLGSVEMLLSGEKQYSYIAQKT